MIPILLVALGGALGSVARYGVNVWTMRAFGPGFPWGTLTVNVVGGLVMGLIAALLALKGGTNELRVFLMTGIMGGFTTFSAFSLDAVALWERGEATTATVYVAASVVLSIGALVAGLALGRALG
ncbi:fluoride efflux transporter CrcB [Chenggangzhangella methanolivorans]|uniref:Fluoride-specific ion channel FluC n=1 Tax=Chenggangzhangella methanolivorans TaxID=1437009 RepID=A0A9E6UI38_9HYPH|nr:fluoride efflux transporter CrcB [Chenggangzhangella methanolivorans]QZO00408.1 fluoride efflux transporter CrcB [Chenggangzhangella methanolivorans]